MRNRGDKISSKWKLGMGTYKKILARMAPNERIFMKFDTSTYFFENLSRKLQWYLISLLHRASFVVMLPRHLKCATLSSYFWSITICTAGGCPEIFLSLVFTTFISSLQHLPVSVGPPIMPCSTFSSLPSSTRSSAYFIAQITCPPVSKYPIPSRGYSVEQLVEALCYKPEGRGFTGIFHWHNPSGRTMALQSAQPPTEMSTRNISWG